MEVGMLSGKGLSYDLKLILGLGVFVWAITSYHQSARAEVQEKLIEAPALLKPQFPPSLSIKLNEKSFNNSRFKEFRDQLKYFYKVWLVFDGKMFLDKSGEPYIASYRVVKTEGKDGQQYPPQSFSTFPLFTTDDLSHTIHDKLDDCKELALNEIKMIQSRAGDAAAIPDYHWVFDSKGDKFRDLSPYFSDAPKVEIVMTLPTGEKKVIPYRLKNLSMIKEIVFGETAGQ